jgi:hypothetical protein
MTTVTDDYMRQKIAQTKEYCIVILKAGPNRHREGVEKIIWEHGRRNFALREEGVLSIVCPVADASEVSGIGIFNAGIDRVRAIMDEDPGVQEGVFVYKIHLCRSFPGDCLPE